jgi:hypothetical protein
MRKVTVLLIAIAMALLAASPAEAKRDVSPFVGHWEAVDGFPGNPDLGDDSRMILNISAGPSATVNVFFKDFGATLCGIDPANGEPLYAGQAKSEGIIDGDVLSTYGRGGRGVGNGAVWCMAGPPFELFPAPGGPTPFVTYDPATDTLSDGFSFYYRVSNN